MNIEVYSKRSFSPDPLEELEARKRALLSVLETIRNPFKLMHSPLVFGSVSVQDLKDLNKELDDIDAELQKLSADK